MADVLAASTPADWRPLDPAHTLYLELDSGRVLIELAPAFAPAHATNILKLARQGYYDGLGIVRVQDNFVVQWGDPEGRRPLGAARATLPPEFTVAGSARLPFTPLPDADGYAPQVGFSGGFPAARDPKSGEAWLAHCYAMVGAGRGDEVDSGNGGELYVVIGHAPRQLDRNIALVGRVVQGMERLASLPRGGATMGFYEQAAQHVPIRRVRVAADLPEAERARLEVLRTDTETFEALIEARRNRRDAWYKVPAGYIDLCNVPIPVRAQ
jgi:peptidylprolyl isomerase